MHRRYLFLLLLFAAITGSFRSSAESFSYIYIEGDGVPFYVKFEGDMQPRYGKNYCIIPKLIAGPVHVQILFQQNIFPPQEYIIRVPDSGSRSFRLTKTAGAYSLYDIQQHFYLPPGNKESDDNLPAVIPVTAAQNDTGRTGPSFKKAFAFLDKKPAFLQRKPDAVTPVDTPDNGPHFIPGITLGAPADAPAKPANQVYDTAMITATRAPEPASTATDCTPVSDTGFRQIYQHATGQQTDEDRVAYLQGETGFCFKCWQVRTLAGTLTGDAARYTFLKNIYPRVSDQSAFPLLDDLLRTNTWKTAFAKIAAPQNTDAHE